MRDITFNPKLAAVRQAVRFRIDLATISAQAELISLLINHQNKLADKVVDNFIQRNSLVPSNLLKKITLVLSGDEHVAARVPRRAVSDGLPQDGAGVEAVSPTGCSKADSMS